MSVELSEEVELSGEVELWRLSSALLDAQS